VKEYRERTYRRRVNPKGLTSFRVLIKETDLWVAAVKDLERETRSIALHCRHQLESYIEAHPEFGASLYPQPTDPFAPPLVKKMIEVARAMDVGPMASVAGAIAQYVAEGLLQHSDQVIVENGGDIYLKVSRPVNVSIFAGDSPLSERLAFRIPAHQMPLAVCSSSGTVGHSFSAGKADVVSVLSESAALADAAATALGNRIRKKEDLGAVANYAKGINEIIGGVVVMGKHMASWGDISLVEL
jgi:ApbE superfamily uncharacterized protein (UPF0280 family)